MKRTFLALTIFVLTLSCAREESTRQHLIDITSIEGGKTDTESGLFEELESISIRAIPDKGYFFESWGGTIKRGQLFHNPIEFNLAYPMEIVARFIKGYSIGVSTTEGGRPQIGGAMGITGYKDSSVKPETPIVIKASSDDGYVFEKWTSSTNNELNDKVDNPLSFKLNQSESIKANFILE
jgi:hypothetical protein